MATVPTNNQTLIAWVNQVTQLTKPARVHWCDGSEAEKDQLCADMVKAGTFTPLNPKLRPGCYLACNHWAPLHNRGEPGRYRSHWTRY